MQKSKWWIYILLASFLLLLVPKNILHDCGVNHSVKKSNRTEYSSAQEHCTICDFQFYPSIEVDQRIFFYTERFIPIRFLAKVQPTFVFIVGFNSPRGPPSDLF